MFKNQASQKIALFAFDTTTGAAKTGDAANLTAYVSKDFGTVTVLTDTSATEMDATNAPGWYLFDLTQGESNGDDLLFTGKSSTANVSIVGRPVTTVPVRFTTMAIDAAGLVDANTVKVEGVDATNQIRDSAQQADTLQRMITLLEPAAGSSGEYRFSLDALRHMPTLIWGAERANFSAVGSFGQYVPANVTYFGGAAGTFSGGRPEVNVTHAAGTAWNSGAIGAATLATDTITAAKIAADAIGASELAADAVTEIQSGLATSSALSTVAGYIDTEVAAIKAKTDNLPSDPADASDIASSFSTVNSTLATIDDRIDTEVAAIKQVTDKLHSMLEAATGSPGESRFTTDALRNAPSGSGGAPSASDVATAVWSQSLPGSFGAGQAGKIVGDNLNATVSSRATQSSVDTIDGIVDSILVDTGTDIPASLATIDGRIDTEIAAIKAKTDNLPSDPADASDISAAFSTVNSTLATVAGYIDTEVAAIKAKTDLIPASPAATGDIPSAGAVADAVWDEALSGHVSSGAAGLALRDADLRGSRTVVRGTVSATSPSTTSFTASALSPAGAVADQFKGRIIIFDNDTSTVELRGQATDITANTSASLPQFTFSALTTAPSSGDTFSIV